MPARPPAHQRRPRAHRPRGSSRATLRVPPCRYLHPWSLLSFGQDSALVGAPSTVERPHRTGPHGPFLVGDTGSGLSNLEGRAAALGGRLEIESQPAEGTTVRVTVP